MCKRIRHTIIKMSHPSDRIKRLFRFSFFLLCLPSVGQPSILARECHKPRREIIIKIWTTASVTSGDETFQLNDAPDFEESLEVVHLAGSHGQEHKCFKEGPHNDP